MTALNPILPPLKSEPNWICSALPVEITTGGLLYPQYLSPLHDSSHQSPPVQGCPPTSGEFSSGPSLTAT